MQAGLLPNLCHLFKNWFLPSVTYFEAAILWLGIARALVVGLYI